MRGARSILSWLDNNSTIWPRQMHRQGQRGNNEPRSRGAQSASVSPNEVGDPAPTDDTLELVTGPGGLSNGRLHSGLHASMGQVNETRFDEDHVVDEQDDSGTFITEQPYCAHQMDYTYVSSETTFPHNRGPNLSKLTKGMA